jgi:uronate dehydrogenase
MAKLHKKIVLTGACGTLGMEIRATLAALTDQLVSVDIAEAPKELLENEVFVQADCAKFDEVLPLMEGANMAVHFASIPDERPFEDLLGPNFLSSYNVWEAGHRHGVQRVIYASSVHAVGMHENSAGINVDADHAPDTFYGLAKCFAEDLGKLYWAKRGMESVHLRIFAVTATTTGFTVIFGISNNDRAPVNNAKATFLGFRPKDNAENWADSLLASAPPADPSDRAQLYLGGPFATVPLGESGVAGIKAMASAAQTASNASTDTRTDAKKLPSFLTKKGMNP